MKPSSHPHGGLQETLPCCLTFWTFHNVGLWALGPCCVPLEDPVLIYSQGSGSLTAIQYELENHAIAIADAERKPYAAPNNGLGASPVDPVDPGD